MYSVGEVNRRADGYDIGGDQDGAGIEQCAMNQLTAGPYAGRIMVACISSNASFPTDLDGDGVYERVLEPGQDVNDTQQGLMVLIDFDATGLPMIVKAHHYTDTNGNRDRNGMHPSVGLAAGGKYFVAKRNYAPNNDVNDNGGTCNANHACTWMTVFDGNGVAMSRVGNNGMGSLIQYKNNDNCSDNNSTATVTRDTCTGDVCETDLADQDGCNGNGRDDSWLTLIGVDCDPADPDANGYECQVYKFGDVSQTRDHERARGECFAVGAGDVVCGVTAGNTQPPNKGVRMMRFDASRTDYPNINGRGQLDRKRYDDEDGNGLYVAENYRDEEGKLVMNTELNLARMGTLGGADENLFMARWQCGYGRGGNKRKGEWLSCAAPVRVRDTGIDVMAAPVTVDPLHDVAHGKFIGLVYGETGSEVITSGHVSGSIAGSSGAASQAVIFGYDSGTRAITEIATHSLVESIDLAHISNIYGNNPNTQGRNFFQGGMVANPKYGETGTAFENVKMFLVTPSSGRNLRDYDEPGVGYPINKDKLDGRVVFTNMVVDPAAVDDPPDNGGDDTGDDTDVDDPGTGPGNDGGMTSGCRAVASSGATSGLALLSLAFIFALRRRRRND